MPYVKAYYGPLDLIWQCQVDDATAEKARAQHCEISDQPFEGVRVLPRNRSEWPADVGESQWRSRADKSESGTKRD